MSDAVATRPVDAFVAAVRAGAAGARILGAGLASFAVDGRAPSVAVFAGSIDDVQACLREAHRRRLAVIPWGAGSHMALGNEPAAYDVALVCTGLQRLVDYQPADMTVTVEAGLPLAELQAMLATERQFVPLDPPGRDVATIGGALAANAQGSLRHTAGTARDWLIGLTVVQADGTLVRSGGRVVKNVAGYDMSKLYIGSLATLGVIVEVTFKLAPRPAASTTLALACDSPHGAAMLLFAARDAGLAVEAAEMLAPAAAAEICGAARWSALVRAAGGASAVGRSVRELRENAAGMQADVREVDAATAWPAWRRRFAGRPVMLGLSVLPSRVADAAEALDGTIENATISCTVSAGVVRAACDATDDAAARAAIAAAREVARQHDGATIVGAAPAAVKRDADVFGPTRNDFPIMRRLKHELDPQRILAPGRFVGRL
ncbi:MAG: FAD-binding oxidoreductase [Dehalococcoidia bacterium]|nr:FAD-binding oxidoreductase [Dehalococcoidia bacterium]